MEHHSPVKIHPTTTEEDDKLRNGIRYIFNVSKAICKYQYPYVLKETRDEAGILMGSLDLDSGNLKSGPWPVFASPLDARRVQDFIPTSMAKNQESDGLSEIDYSFDPRPENMGDSRNDRGVRWHNARYLLSKLEQYSKSPEEGPMMNTHLQKCERNERNERHYPRHRTDIMYGWSADFIMTSIDRTNPYMLASVVDGDVLKEGELTTGEAAVAFRLVNTRRLKDKFKNRFIPITIVSASYRDVRVVQVVHDSNNPRHLHFRVSRIMKFYDGAESNWGDWILLLRWMMAEPARLE